MAWIVRVALMIGLAGFAVPAEAQRQLDPPIAELVQKATAGESENGFCARTGWPVRAPAELIPRYRQWLSGADMGGAPWQWRSPTGCTTAIVEGVGASGGRRCLRTRTFVCGIGGTCVSTPGDWCRTADEGFERCRCD